MSAPIGSSTSRSAGPVAAQARPATGHSAAASAVLGQAGGSRPQVQSRRVSLKLGPLGITYSTDQLLWPDAAPATAPAAAAAGNSLSPGPDPDAEPVDAVSGLPGSGQHAGQASQTDQAGQAQQAIRQTGRSFHQELAQAWRRQVEERAAAAGTYGPDGALRSGAASATAAAASSSETGTFAPAAAAALSATSAAAPTVAPTSVTGAPSSTATAAQNTTAPPATRMRRAIGAYLACAREFSAAQPMLTAVA